MDGKNNILTMLHRWSKLFQGLVNGGKVHGSVEVIGCSKISKEELEGSVDKHGVEDVSLIQYEQVFAWELSNPCRYSPPILCVPKPGARIWKNLEYPSSGARALKMLTKARSASDVNGKAFLELALDMRLQLFEKSKRPYWRIQEKDLDFTMKFEFTKDNLDEKKQKAVEAMELRHYISCLEDEAFCVTSSEIRAWLQERGLPKTGSKDALASRMVSKKLKYHLADLASLCSASQVAAAAALVKGPQDGAPPQPNPPMSSASEHDAKNQDDPEPTEPPKKKSKSQENLTKGQMMCKFFVQPPVASAIWRFSSEWIYSTTVLFYLRMPYCKRNIVFRLHGSFTGFEVHHVFRLYLKCSVQKMEQRCPPCQGLGPCSRAIGGSPGRAR